jgi:transcription initiation factor IIF auxiliary subunit
MEKHKQCQLESTTMDSSSSPQGATGSAKTDPSNAYQQQYTKGTFHKRSGLQSTNTQQGNYEETLLKQTVVDRPLLKDTTHKKKTAKATQKRNTTKSQQNRKNDGDQIIYISSLEQQIQNQNKTIELLKKKKIWR